jgi:hypothetical protein
VPAARRKTKPAAPRRKRRADGPSITKPQRMKLLDGLRLGLPREDAIKLIGLPKSTFYDWLQRGEKPGAAVGWRKFREDVELATAEFEYGALSRIGEAGARGEWQADAWRLERIRQDRYMKRSRVDSNVTVTAQPMWDTSKLTLEEKQELARLIRKASPEPDQLEQGQAPVLELLRGGDVIEGELVDEA